MNNFRAIKILFGTILVSIFGVISVQAKIEVNVDRTYEITVDNRMLVSEVHTVENKSEDLWIPAEEFMTFQILGFRSGTHNEQYFKQALESVSIKDEKGIIQTYESEIQSNQIVLKVPYGRDLLPNDKRAFVFEYEHPGLLYINGALRDGYIHAFSPDFVFETNTTKFNFTTTLVHSQFMPEVNFVVPTPSFEGVDGIKKVYKFETTDLIDQFVWIQFGVEQNYKFTIEQEIAATDLKPTGFINRFEIIIPRDIFTPIITQKVYIESISPEPVGVYADGLGNLIGVFEFSSHENHTVRIDGFAVVTLDNAIDLAGKVGEVSDIPEQIVKSNTSSSEFWEVDAPNIRETANQIIGNSTNVFEIVDSMYNFVVETIDYSTVKRFGINERQGALATLNGGAAVCMEYSDLFLTLMRAKGIPTRAVFGYGYDPRIESTNQEAHQWVQVYMPGVDGWVDVDVTWGESGDKLIGGDLNHFYTHVANIHPNNPAMFSRFGYSSGGELAAPKFDIETIEVIPKDTRTMSTPDGLLERYRYTRESELGFLTKQIVNTYMLGWNSLREGFSFDNKAQLTLLGSLLVVLSLLAILIQLIFRKPKKRLDVSNIKLKSFERY